MKLAQASTDGATIHGSRCETDITKHPNKHYNSKWFPIFLDISQTSVAFRRVLFITSKSYQYWPRFVSVISNVTWVRFSETRYRFGHKDAWRLSLWIFLCYFWEAGGRRWLINRTGLPSKSMTLTWVRHSFCEIRELAYSTTNVVKQQLHASLSCKTVNAN